MAQENVVVVRFTEPSKAHQALSVLKECDSNDRIELKSAAVVERTATGELRTVDDWDNLGPIGTAGGSLIGTLIGVLGGPVGALLGWGAGAALGGVFDIDHAVSSDEAITVLGTAIPAGSTAVIAEVEEYAVEVIDGEMKKLGSRTVRRASRAAASAASSAAPSSLLTSSADSRVTSPSSGFAPAASEPAGRWRSRAFVQRERV